MPILKHSSGLRLYIVRNGQPTADVVLIAHGGWADEYGFTNVDHVRSVYFYASHWEYGKVSTGKHLAMGEAVPERVMSAAKPTDAEMKRMAKGELVAPRMEGQSSVKNIIGRGGRVQNYGIEHHDQVNELFISNVENAEVQGANVMDFLFVENGAGMVFYSEIWAALAGWGYPYNTLHSTACRVVAKKSGDGYQDAPRTMKQMKL